MAYDYLVQKRLSERTGLSASQVQTLLVLLDFPVMDYQIVETLKLFPPSKMRNRVLGPLKEAGWVILHSYPPRTSHTGASRMAWSLAPGKESELRSLVSQVRKEVDKAEKSARLNAAQLAEDLFGKDLSA